MQVVVTGSGSALGQALLRQIVVHGQLTRGDGAPVPVQRILAVDRVQPAGLFLDPRIEYVRGDYALPRFLSRMMGATTDSVFHLAPLDPVDESGEPYAVLEAALGQSVDITRALLEACHFQSARVRVVLASTPGAWLERGGRPCSTREACTAMCELLLAESSRRHIVDARCVRLADPAPADAPGLLIAAHERPRAPFLPDAAPPA